MLEITGKIKAYCCRHINRRRSRSRLDKIRLRITEMDEEARRVHYRIASGNSEELARLEAEEADLIAELENKKPKRSNV